MPLKHLRVCEYCQAVRFAPCGKACRVPNEVDPASWRINLQAGAGTLPAESDT